MNLKDKVAIVTGGSRGIGAGICEKLAREGAKIVINYNTALKQAEELRAGIERSGGTAMTVKANIGDMQQVKNLYDETIKRFGKIDILVNNAAVCKFAEFFDITEDLWDETQNTNIKGHFFLSQWVARQMVDKKIKGRIITISSIGAWVGTLQQAHYCTTKAAGSNLMKSLAVTFGPYGITCNAVLPGVIETDINRDFLADKENYDLIINQIPSKLIGKPKDVAGIVAFLATDEARYINGVDILVDGGAYVTSW